MKQDKYVNYLYNPGKLCQLPHKGYLILQEEPIGFTTLLSRYKIPL